MRGQVAACAEARSAHCTRGSCVFCVFRKHNYSVTASRVLTVCNTRLVTAFVFHESNGDQVHGVRSCTFSCERARTSSTRRYCRLSHLVCRRGIEP
jgi:hypothetical protein